MKRLFIFLALPWMCGACSENKEAAAPQAVETVAASDTTNAGLKADSAEVDAVSGATAVANAPSFNGILFLPPQHQVSVTFTMGGAVNTLAVSPGKFVKKGEVLATLKTPELSCSRSIWMRRLRRSFWNRSMPVRRISCRTRRLQRRSSSRARPIICRQRAGRMPLLPNCCCWG